jgi:hypothetical protein
VDVGAVNRNIDVGDMAQLWVHWAEFLEVLYTEIRKRGCAKLETNKRAVELELCIMVYVFCVLHFGQLLNFNRTVT